MSIFKSNRTEKRQFKRFERALNAKFKIISGANPSEMSSELRGIVTDISSEGLSLEAGIVQIGHFHISHDSSMMKKNRLGIELQCPQNDTSKSTDSIYILGEVVWYSKKDTNSQYPYHVGVKTLNISENDKPKLETLLTNG